MTIKKYIIILFLLFLTGCSSPPIECDYIKFIEQSNTLISQNTLCQSEKTICVSDLAVSKSTSNELKLQLLNNNTNTKCTQTSTDCTTIVRLLNKKEEQLEECWSNSTIVHYNITNTFQNQTLLDMYNNCTAKLNSINDTIN